MRPVYSITKRRNILRIYGTVAGAIVGFVIVYYITNPIVLFGDFLGLSNAYFQPIKRQICLGGIFMTVYIFLILIL